MIINLDDIIYLYKISETYIPKYVKNCENIEKLIKHPRFDWFVYMMFKKIMQCRLPELEPFLGKAGVFYFYLIMFHYQEQFCWLESEEKIRTLRQLKSAYENRIRRKI